MTWLYVVTGNSVCINNNNNDDDDDDDDDDVEGNPYHVALYNNSYLAVYYGSEKLRQ